MSGYVEFARVYDTLMSDVDYAAMAQRYNSLITENGITGGILLDLACGTGSLSVLMAQKNRDVIGVDISQEMLSTAKRHDKVTYICQSMTELDLYGTIDACLCVMDSLNHLTDETEVQKTLERVSLFMNPGGVFVFDMNTIYKHETILADNIYIKQSDNVYCIWQNDYQGNGIVDITLEIFMEGQDGLYERFTEEIRERAYETDVIRKLCEKSGFEIINITEEDNERVVFVCRKKRV
ncbi:MAG: methyltransferase domain-containing protein [Oscillospiraceae bacterium]|nr:methyltransferase domain-containing protein [Oscillospiraceae bacterium]